MLGVMLSRALQLGVMLSQSVCARTRSDRLLLESGSCSIYCCVIVIVLRIAVRSGPWMIPILRSGKMSEISLVMLEASGD